MNAASDRMSSEDRRAQIIAAAALVFGERGYAGGTTDAIAKQAGISQAYVVRMFGTKEKLFVEVLERALEILLQTFRTAIADASDVPVRYRMGIAYINLLSERGLLLSLMHSFVLGSDPVIGEVARGGFLTVYEFLRSEANMSSEEAGQFLAGGMLSNTMIGLRMTDLYEQHPVARELLAACFPEKLDVVVGLGDAYRPEPK
jgi:TetR/AcrR family transcriptional regulator